MMNGGATVIAGTGYISLTADWSWVVQDPR
jgi:hypothetical protein